MPIEPPTRVAHAWRRESRLRLCVVIGAALLAPAAAASPAAASPAIYDGISADGSVAVFSTEESLVPGDTDRQRDVYERSYDKSLERYVTREVSIGPTGGNDAYPAQFDAISADGTKVFFSTREQLVPGDQDHSIDIYMRDLTTNTTTLVSQGAASCQAEGCGNGEYNASFAPGGLSANGEELFFVTSEPLSPADHDSSPDIYMRNLTTNTTTLVSQGAASCQAEGCGNGENGVTFNAVSADGSTVAFSSSESLSSEDHDELQDVYVRDLATETTRLVSTTGKCPGSVDCKAVFGGMSSNGSHVFFETSEQISPEDTDESQDVYDWTPGGGAVLDSTGPDGGNGPFNATFAGNSADGSTVYFETSERIDPGADTDETNDIYKRSGGVTELVSTGPEGGNGPYPASLHWVSPDGSAAIFTTSERLTANDEDNSQDVYERAGSTTTLISTGSEGPEGGNGPFDASFAGISGDGSRVFFNTSERLVPEDQDSSSDIYVRSGGVTELVSTGPEGGNGAFDPVLAGVSHDGEHAFFTTEERMTEGDVDAELDVYERSGSTTRLVSVGNLTALGPATPTLTATSPSSPGASKTPSILGQATPGSWVKLYSSFDCSGEPAAQGTAAELEGEGLAVSVAEDSTTSFRATAEAEGLVSPCSAPISYRQQENPPPPPPPVEEPGGGKTGGSGSGQGGGLGWLEEARFRKGDGQGGSPYVRPHTLITFGPASKTRKRKVVLRFADGTGQLGSRFVCKLDRHGWRPCGSPKRLAGLSLGKHVFSVKAVNAVGVWDERAATRSFKVVR
jgi:hypothetical protein